MPIDWHEFHASQSKAPVVVDAQRRLRLCAAGFAAMALLVFGRAVQLEVAQGSAFRAEASSPLRHQESLPGVRGRILARDGAVLAYDKQVPAVAVQYRYLQEPPDPRWLRQNARARLSKSDRKNPQRMAAEEDRLRDERAELAKRLSQLCGMSAQQWNDRARTIQARVEHIIENVKRRRQAETALREVPSDAASDSFADIFGRWLRDSFGTSRDDGKLAEITVAEELQCHVMAEDVPLSVVAEIEGNAEQYPGVKVLRRSRRVYPAGRMAAHVLGHLGPAGAHELQPAAAIETAYQADDLVGRLGLERQYESRLRGSRGVAVEVTDHGGRVLSSFREREPGVGRDLVLTLDSQLQQTAEDLLDSALKRRQLQSEVADAAGGAIVVMDVGSGALRALAAAPRFDPNWFVTGKTDELAALLRDKTRPLFDRACRMAIPPGSVFKALTSVALLQAAAVDPRKPFFCQGYLHRPDSQRCEIYVRSGVGHGDVTLSDALCRSCNVYFFHHSGLLGPGPLVDWAQRFGFGRPTGVDLPGEAAGTLPTPDNIGTAEGHAWRTADTEALSIGQGALTATPLQIARMMAAVANGGQLVTPHLVGSFGLPSDDQPVSEIENDLIQVPPPQAIPGIQSTTLGTVREGLARVVDDAEGTAHGTVYLAEIAVAGKTGTAETGEGRAAHAWFAGYVPAERPKYAVVVALEHAGSGATAAGPVVKRLVLRMRQLGML